MSKRESYMPGPAAGAEIRKDGDLWTLVVVRELHHPPANVWKALTDPAHLREWAPFDADGNLATAGKVKLTTVGAPGPHVTESTVMRAESPRLLEYDWGGSDLRWELEPLGGGTKLTLWHPEDFKYLPRAAAGWHICFDVMERFLANEPIGRFVGPEIMKFEGWQRLNAEYAKKFGVEPNA